MKATPLSGQVSDMALKNSKKQKSFGPAPSLGALISAIDRRIDQVPNPIVAKGFEALLERGGQAGKHNGRQYIQFVLNDVVFALPLRNTLEIDYMTEITPLPNLPSWVLGICHLRGEIISVIDIKQVLRLAPGQADRTKKLIVVGHEGVHTAIVVDKIERMLMVDDAVDGAKTKAKEDGGFSRFVESVVSNDLHNIHLLNVDFLMKAIRL